MNAKEVLQYLLPLVRENSFENGKGIPDLR